MQTVTDNAAAAFKAIVTTPAQAYIAARAEAEVLRKEIDGYKDELLTVNDFRADPEWDGLGGHRIIKPSDDWLMAEADFARYSAALTAKCEAAGHDADMLAEGHCPALVAEDAQRKAEAALIDAIGEGLAAAGAPNAHKIRANNYRMTMDERRQLVNLACRMAV